MGSAAMEALFSRILSGYSALDLIHRARDHAKHQCTQGPLIGDVCCCLGTRINMMTQLAVANQSITPSAQLRDLVTMTYSECCQTCAANVTFNNHLLFLVAEKMDMLGEQAEHTHRQLTMLAADEVVSRDRKRRRDESLKQVVHVIVCT